MDTDSQFQFYAMIVPLYALNVCATAGLHNRYDGMIGVVGNKILWNSA